MPVFHMYPSLRQSNIARTLYPSTCRRGGNCEQDSSVFSDVYEFVQDGQGHGRAVRLPAVIGLHRIDQCDSLRIDTPEPFRLKRILEAFPVVQTGNMCFLPECCRAERTSSHAK